MPWARIAPFPMRCASGNRRNRRRQAAHESRGESHESAIFHNAGSGRLAPAETPESERAGRRFSTQEQAPLPLPFRKPAETRSVALRTRFSHSGCTPAPSRRHRAASARRAITPSTRQISLRQRQAAQKSKRDPRRKLERPTQSRRRSNSTLPLAIARPNLSFHGFCHIRQRKTPSPCDIVPVPSSLQQRPTAPSFLATQLRHPLLSQDRQGDTPIRSADPSSA